MKRPRSTESLIEPEQPELFLDKGVLGRQPRENVKLVWPSVRHANDTREHDSNVFPSPAMVKARYLHNEAIFKAQERGFLGCEAFWLEVCRSHTVLIFDPHFSPAEVRRLRDALSGSRTIATLCILAGTVQRREMDLAFKELQRELGRQRRDAFIELRMGMLSTAPPYPHDRFAVTDGELWHFGGTVGGGQKCMTALSRGWSAKDYGFDAFFRDAWKSMPATSTGDEK